MAEVFILLCRGDFSSGAFYSFNGTLAVHMRFGIQRPARVKAADMRRAAEPRAPPIRSAYGAWSDPVLIKIRNAPHKALEGSRFSADADDQDLCFAFRFFLFPLSFSFSMISNEEEDVPAVPNRRFHACSSEPPHPAGPRNAVKRSARKYHSGVARDQLFSFQAARKDFPHQPFTN